MGSNTKISFNVPVVSGRELQHIRCAVLSEEQISVNGRFTRQCREWLLTRRSADAIELTGSCTAAIEIAAELCDLSPGDQVILPSFTHPSTANAFHARNADLRFIDIRPDTLCFDEQQVENTLCDRTRVVIPVHYAGTCCDMARLLNASSRYQAIVMEDAAQAFGSSYGEHDLGTLGDLGVYSFHETKNVQCGAGGAILLKSSRLQERLYVLLDKGTNREVFEQGKVNAYSWQGWGSAYRLPELAAAYLWGQLQEYEQIQSRRETLYEMYRSRLSNLEDKGLFSLPGCLPQVTHNAHIFYILLECQTDRDNLIAFLNAAGIEAVRHYVPLHLSPVGRRLGYRPGMLPITESIAERLVRLPLHLRLNEQSIDYVCSRVRAFFEISNYAKYESTGR